MADERDREVYAARWESWHRDVEVQRASPLGFLAVTGLHWLNPQPQRFDDAPGAWSSGEYGVRIELNDDEVLVVDDVRVTGHYDFGIVDEYGMRATFADCVVEVCRRDGQFMIRPRNPNNEVLARYSGTPTYPPSVAWVIEGTFIAYAEPRSVTVGATVEGLAHVHVSSGEAEFVIEGRTLRLTAFNDEVPGELSIIFSDLTSGTTTYPACRFLTINSPRDDGSVVVDFNRATNPACAYTNFATCPLAPTGNQLPIRVEAGEKRPVDSHSCNRAHGGEYAPLP